MLQSGNPLLILINLIPCLHGALIWSDEFAGVTLDTSKWNYYTGRNNELQKYTNRDVNVFVENGHLVLQAWEETFNGCNYTSGRIDTKSKGDFMHCIVKVRAKVPFGQGLFPAIWLKPSYEKHGPGLASGELDIMEHLGHQRNIVHSTVHFGKNLTDRMKKSNSYVLPRGNFSDDFHEFIMDWKENQIDFFVDDNKVMSVTPSDVPNKYAYPFDDYFYLVLNVAVGGKWPGPPDQSTKFPQRMEVDYVRIYDQEK